MNLSYYCHEPQPNQAVAAETVIQFYEPRKKLELSILIATLTNLTENLITKSIDNSNRKYSFDSAQLPYAED